MTMAQPIGDAADDRAAGYVDWDFARLTGRRLVNPGPRVSRDEAAAIVADLRAAAATAHAPVAA